MLPWAVMVIVCPRPTVILFWLSTGAPEVCASTLVPVATILAKLMPKRIILFVFTEAIVI